MSKNGNGNGVPLPEWYQKACSLVAIQQAEVIVLSGDVVGYPVSPGKNLTEFLRDSTLSVAVKRCRKKDESFDEKDPNDPGKQARLVAQERLFVQVAPAFGLDLESGAQQNVFDAVSPPPESNPFAAGGGGGNGIDQAFERLDAYFRNSRVPTGDDPAPALTVVIKDADLLFAAERPLVEPETTLLSFIRQWAAKPLETITGEAHRIFLVSANRKAIRDSLFQGRVEPIQIPLPTAEERERFVETVLAGAQENDRNIALEEGLAIEELARITGALNLVQVEDILYQAGLQGGIVTRRSVQERKDALVAKTYGGVIEIEYPEFDFDRIVGYGDLKKYMTDYVYKRMAAGDGRCPKGCVLTGPPGTGKTIFAQALAAALGLPLVKVSMDRIKEKWVGASNKNVTLLTEGIVALSPAIVLFDELDTVLSATADDSTGVTQEIRGQLQTFLSDLPRGTAFFIGTTNYPKKIPPALLRPGRFEQVIPLLPQHLDGQRGQCLEVLAQQLNVELDCDTQQLEAIGNKATDYCGADLEKLLIEGDREAAEDGRTQVTFEDLDRSLGFVVPTLKSSLDMVDEALACCTNRRFVPASMREKVGQEVAVPEAGRRGRQVRRDENIGPMNAS